MAGEQGLDILDVNSLRLIGGQELGGKFASAAFHSASFVYCSSSGQCVGGVQMMLCIKSRFLQTVKWSILHGYAIFICITRSLAFCEADGYIWFDYLGTLSLIKESVSTPSKTGAGIFV